ncbi:MAG TPA: aldolase/citrate lyase family protein [Candidatus Limnocylindrales bacterium]
MLENRTKAKLAAGEAAFGCFVRTPEPQLIEYVGMLGWDFLVFDAEHGPLVPREVEDLCRAIEPRGTTPMVRVTTNDAPTILRFLDTGAHGVHVPWVNSAAEAERAVKAVKYSPRGTRGLAGSRASEWGLREPIGDYVQRANRETLVVIQVETQDAVDAIEDYLAIDGVDVLFLGPTDLSQSLGHPGDLNHPDVLAAMNRVADAVIGSGKTLGIYAGSVDMTKEWLDRGARYFTTSLEPFLRDGMGAHLRAVRG